MFFGKDLGRVWSQKGDMAKVMSLSFFKQMPTFNTASLGPSDKCWITMRN